METPRISGQIDRQRSDFDVMEHVISGFYAPSADTDEPRGHANDDAPPRRSRWAEAFTPQAQTAPQVRPSPACHETAELSSTFGRTLRSDGTPPPATTDQKGRQSLSNAEPARGERRADDVVDRQRLLTRSRRCEAMVIARESGRRAFARYGADVRAKPLLTRTR